MCALNLHAPSHEYEEQAIPNLKSFSHKNSKFVYCVNSTSAIEPETNLDLLDSPNYN